MRFTLVTALTVAAAAIATAAPAQASCFYNKSEIATVGVSLDCGTFCSNEWAIKKGDHACRGGEGGPFKLDATGENEGSYLTGNVDDRGYVVVTGSCGGGMYATVYHGDHSVKQQLARPGGLISCK